MNKRIKLTITSLLLIGAFSSIYPGNFFNMTTKAYAAASTYSRAEDGELKSLEIKSTDNKTLQLCDDYDGYNSNLTDEKTYYVTLDAKNDGLNILAQAAGDDYVVKVFESDRKNATAHDVGEDISLLKGISTLYIRTYITEEAFKRAKKNEDVTNCSKTYKINVNKSVTDGADDIYLTKLNLNSGNIPINFNKDVLLYNIFVNADIYELIIQATPEDDDYTVKIDGNKVIEEDKYKRMLPLKMGKNEIKINITGDDLKFRTYTLNITRGTVTSTSSTNTTTSKISSDNSKTAKMNQWVQVNNKWQYNDATGTTIKNSWFYDRNYGETYYLQADGSMANGWLKNNGKWYYLGTGGGMKIGWILDGSKYYYLYSDGAMAYDTTIDGYKLDVTGAWNL